MFGGELRGSSLPPRSGLADPWKEKSIARQGKEPLGNSAEQAGNKSRGEMGREGISTYEGLTPGKPRLVQEFLDGLRGEVVQMIRCVVKAIRDAEQSQKVLNRGSVWVSYQNETPGLENPMTLPQKGHWIIKVLDEIKGRDHVEVIIGKLALRQCLGEDIEPQPLPAILYPCD